MPRSNRAIRSGSGPIAAPALLALALAGGLVGCATSSSGAAGASARSATDVVSSGPLAGRTAAEVYATALAAATSAAGVHLTASLHQGQSISLDLSVVAGRGAAGTFTLGGATAKVVEVGSTVYALPSKAFLAKQGAAAALLASRLGHKWIKVDASMAALTNLGSVSSYTSAADAITAIAPKNATFSLVSGQIVNGADALGVRFTTGQRTGTLYVAGTGTPYPLRLESAQLGTISFTNWGKKATITVPAATDVLDLNKLSLSGLG